MIKLKSDNKYDVVLVLGSGVYKDGSIPESAEARIRKAKELFDKGTVDHIILSGKWSYRLDYTPPLSEAGAMAEYGESIELSHQKILLENESTTTMTNFYFIKKILRENGWRKVILVINRPYVERTKLNMEMVLGPDYECEVIEPDYRFPKEKEEELVRIEVEKIKVVREFYKDVKPGDDESIYNRGLKLLR